MRRALLATALVLIAPAPALASGGALSATFGGTGATSPGSALTYVAVDGGRRSVIQAVEKTGGSVRRSRRLPGAYGTPLVAFDGSTTGLSADGRTLVLVQAPRTYPPARTRLLVLSAGTLQTRERVTLAGYSSVDAVSPDGRWVYLVHYRHPVRDVNDYEVRAYDLINHRLDPKPVIDPSEPDEKMGGQPLTRTMSADERWAYTLYDAKEPFVHALDTAGRTAVCIDLDDLAGTNLADVKLTLDGPMLHVGGLATIDTRTHKPVARDAAPAPTARPAPAREDGGAFPWPLAAAGLAALALIALVVRRHRRPAEAEMTVAHRV